MSILKSRYLLMASLMASLVATPASHAQDIADLVSQIEPSVVRIEVLTNEGGSLGSGFVIDDQGTIVTNCHVLAGAVEAVAIFANGRKTPVQGTYIVDTSRDIVIAKIGLTDAPAIRIASEYPRKGSKVLAIGAPKGLDFSVSDGIVSAIRSAETMASDTGMDTLQGTWIQTTAPLSPGNSGGPLINTRGEVVAMNTLASTGNSQNLNFGISAKDISNAIRFASRSRLTSLREGVARIEMEESTPEARESGLAAKRIPADAYSDYIAVAQEEFEDLMREVKRKVQTMRWDVRDIRDGKTYLPYAVREAKLPFYKEPIPGSNGRKHRFYFESQKVKDDMLSSVQRRMREMEEIADIKNLNDSDSLFKLLWTYGPRLETRNNKSVGFVTDLIALHAFDSHSVLAILDDQPYLVWMESTAGISGGEIIAGPMFVAGTSTAELRSGLTQAVTVLQEVTEDSLNKAVNQHFADKLDNGPLIDGLADGYRMWNDNSGQYSVMAILLGVDGDKVRLKKQADGKVISVPIKILSAADVRYIRN